MLLPDLSKMACVSVPAGIDPEDPKSLRPDKQLENVPGDGACLFHCLVRLRQLSDPWLGTATAPAPNVGTLKEIMRQYFLSNYESEFMKHWESYLLWHFGLTPGARRGMGTSDLAFRYADQMVKTNRWGGDLEIDIASHLFGVIIHKFERNTENNDSPTALLTGSFYPTDDLSDKNRSVTKWVLVLLGGHFNYVVPSRPLGAKTPSPPPAPPAPSAAAPSGEGNSESRADAIRRLKSRQSESSGLATRDGTRTRQKNTLLNELERERRARQNANAGPVCELLGIKNLDPAERRQLDDLEKEDDAALARRLQKQEEERIRQIGRDREMALRMRNWML